MNKFLIGLLLVCVSLVKADVSSDLPSRTTYIFGTNNIYTNLLAQINTNNLSQTNMVNVMNFGAIADNSTDNQVAISNAWKSIASESGKILFFPPGVYKSRQLNLTSIAKNNYTIYGPGAVLKPYETNQWQISLTGNRIRIDDITFDADFKTYYNIFQNDNSDQWIIRGVAYLNPYIDNYMDSGGTGGVVSHLLRKGCDGNIWIGCTFSNATFSSTGNISRFCKQIYTQITTTNAADWSKNHVIVGNHFYNCLGDGQTEGDCVEIAGPNGDGWKDFSTIIMANTFDGYTRRAIKTIGGNFSILGNTLQTTISNAFQYGGISGYGPRHTIIGNTINAPFFSGIELAGSVPYGYATNCVIANNVIYNPAPLTTTSRGIRIDSGTTNSVIIGNVISGTQFGVSVLSACDGISIRGNEILNTGRGVVITTNGATATTPQNIFIENNHITSTTNGVFIEFGTNIITRFNSGVAGSTFINRTAGVTGQSLFNGYPPAITTATLDFGSINAAAQADLTITVAGAATGDTISLSLPAAPAAGIIFNAFVSSADTVTVRASNITGSPVDPVSASYTVQVIKQ